MSRFRVYIKPFDEAGDYQSTFTEVTSDLIEISSLQKTLDNTEYDVGIFKNSKVSLKLRNNEGKYSDVENPESMFAYRRSNSLVKVTWDKRDSDMVCGFFTPDTAGICGGEIEVFKGLLNDLSSKTDVNKQQISFQILGLESILSEVDVNFASLADGDTVEEILFTILNQTAITDLLTVDASNISVAQNQAADAVAELENKTVLQALTGDSDLLLMGNAVLYILDDTIHVAPRTATASVIHNFYGQASSSGVENIIKIDDFRIGINRIFNFITWKDTTLSSEDITSTARYGLKTKDLDSPLFTNTTKRQNILDDVRDEFGDPKKEFVVTAPLDYATVALFLLDRVSVSYPPISFPVDSDELPFYGVASYGVVFPSEDSSFIIEDDERFKIMNMKISPGFDVISFRLREI